jgi:hypothetical protein
VPPSNAFSTSILPVSDPVVAMPPPESVVPAP